MAEYIRIGEPANEAERMGFRLLRDQLPDHYRILGNFDLRLPSRRTSLEFDAVVIGEYGFFAVEIKGWSGFIKGGARNWVLRWGKRSNPLSFLEKKTKALGQFIRQRVDDLPDDCFFAPALFFPRDGVQFDLPPSIMRSIVGPASVYEYFVDMDLVREKGPGPFRAAEKIKEVVEAIVAFSEPSEVGVVLPYYDIEEELETGDKPYREYVGSHQYLRSRAKVRVKAYSMDSLAANDQLRVERNRILRDIEALEVLDDNPYVARSYEMQPDYKDEMIFYLVSEWVGAHSLRDFIDENQGDEDVGETIDPLRRKLAHHLVEAVASIHEKGIVHRNLHPGVVYLTEGRDASIPLKVADFDFARVTQLESIADALSHIGTNGYKAPELWLEEEYDHRVDVFSLGAILFELMTSRVLFLGPGALLRPEEAWRERGGLLRDDQIRSVVQGMVSTDVELRAEAMQRARTLFEPAEPVVDIS